MAPPLDARCRSPGHSFARRAAFNRSSDGLGRSESTVRGFEEYEAEFNTMREDMDALGIGASFTPLKPYDKWGPY